MKELKYFNNWSSSFWLTLFWVCFFGIPINYYYSCIRGAFFIFVTVLLGDFFNSECPGDCFWEKLCMYFWTFDKIVVFFFIPMLPLTLIFICRHPYSFSSGKKWRFSEGFLFLERSVHRKNKQLLPDFSLNRFSN